jgi:hypothetical protein
VLDDSHILGETSSSGSSNIQASGSSSVLVFFFFMNQDLVMVLIFNPKFDSSSKT